MSESQTQPAGLPFLKGHGTQNDFVIVPDPDGLLDLGPAQVARLCDRRAGIGGDGVLRVVRSARDEAAHAMADRAEWFMDYRNSDGSIGEMCGNGVRVFARYLVHAGLAKPGPLAVATRAGVREVLIAEDGPDGAPGDITVDMGHALLPGPDDIRVTVGERQWPALNVNMGNPHAVAFVADLEQAGTLVQAPGVAPATAYPTGVNVEFVVDRGERHVAMRVHERGVGETRSCGTGTVAATLAALNHTGAETGSLRVVIPGGEVNVTITENTSFLRGPSVLLAHGELAAEWWHDNEGNSDAAR